MLVDKEARISNNPLLNLVRMVAANVLRGDVRLAEWSDLPDCGAFLPDVREEEEFNRGSIDRAINIPLVQLGIPHRVERRDPSSREAPNARPREIRQQNERELVQGCTPHVKL
jgi:rhodanese-related sulfurtransferase